MTGDELEGRDELRDKIEEWAYDHEWLVSHPEILAEQLAEYAFNELLGIK